MVILGTLAALLLLVAPASSLAQTTRPAAVPVEATTAVVDAFKTHELVAVSDAHGNVQNQAFLKALVRDPRFSQVADDIVIEFGNARYQDIVDRYVQGESVDEAQLRKAWTETTVANEIPVDEEFFSVVRAVNQSRPPAERLRVLLADPPIDWTTVKTRADHFTWLGMRDSFPAALIQVEVLAKRRRALIVYGHLHFQRQNVMSNFDMSDWRMHTLVSLIERSSPARVFTIWAFDDELIRAQADVSSWRAAAITRVGGTQLGALDITALLGNRPRSSFVAGKMAMVPESDWRKLAVEDQLDAILYLGPRSALTTASPSGRRCGEPGYLDERLRRIALTGIPAFEADTARKVCGASK